MRVGVYAQGCGCGCRTIGKRECGLVREVSGGGGQVGF